MENQETFKTPGKTLAVMQVVHFGKILFNLQFIAVAVMVASIISVIIPAIYYLLLTCVAIISLFSLFADPTFVSLWEGGEALTEIAQALMRSWPYTIAVVAVFSALSIVCLCLDRYKKHPVRITFSAIIFALDMLILVIKLASMGVFA